MANKLNRILYSVLQHKLIHQVYLGINSQLRTLFFNKILKEFQIIFLKISQINYKILNKFWLCQIFIRNLLMILLDFLIVFWINLFNWWLLKKKNYSKFFVDQAFNCMILSIENILNRNPNYHFLNFSYHFRLFILVKLLSMVEYTWL